MKEFEKWWGKNPNFECITTNSCAKCKRDAKIIWKAALEWGLSKQKQICDDNCPIQVIPTFVIEEELQK